MQKADAGNLGCRHLAAADLVMTLSAFVMLTAVTCALALAGDWLTAGGDPQNSRWQRHGTRLTSDNAKSLKLLWKRPLEHSPAPPVIMNPTITHRGVRELLFIADAAGDLYALDADLGTVFWKRHFDAAAPSPCAARRAPAPVFQSR